MKLVRCRKCGTVVISEETLLQNLLDAIDETSRKAERCNNNAQKTIYIAEISAYKQMYKSFMHNLTRLGEQKQKDTVILWELKRYIRDNGLIPEDKLIEITESAVKKAKQEQTKYEQEIQRIYGDFNSVTVNRTKADPTANKALRDRR